MAEKLDAVVVGAGPNGLAAAIALARAGWHVRIYEAAATPGGGARTEALTLPGFKHDVCSAVHPLGVASPFFKSLRLEKHGLQWVHPPLPLAHPLENGEAATLWPDLERTAERLGADGKAWNKLFEPFVRKWEALVPEVLAPFHWPRHPLLMARLGLKGRAPASKLARRVFATPRARALFAGLAAHGLLPLDYAFTSAIGMMLALPAFGEGWPMPRGGAQSLTDALVACFSKLGGELVLENRIGSLSELPPTRALLLDITPRQLLRIAGDRVPAGLRRKLENYRYGMGAYKIDWALSQQAPFRDPLCMQAGVVHLGGTLEEIEASEAAASAGQISEKPFALFAQPTLFDTTRAPRGKHVAWGYCHVPHASTEKMTERIENQIERFAPGFRDCILARHVRGPEAMERYNENYVGGDINGGMQHWPQLFSRPVSMWRPYHMWENIYLCSSSTPPGGAVHGMCGYHAAQAVLKDLNR